MHYYSVNFTRPSEPLAHLGPNSLRLRTGEPFPATFLLIIHPCDCRRSKITAISPKMGSLGFTYLSNTPELAAARRKKLDWYASVAQISQLVIVLSIPLGKLVISTLVKVLDTEGNSSLGAQKVAQQPGRKRTATARLARFVRILKFRSGAEVVQGCGTYQEWIFGLLWVAWLGFLCVSETVPGMENPCLNPRTWNQDLTTQQKITCIWSSGSASSPPRSCRYTIFSP